MKVREFYFKIFTKKGFTFLKQIGNILKHGVGKVSSSLLSLACREELKRPKNIIEAK